MKIDTAHVRIGRGVVHNGFVRGGLQNMGAEPAEGPVLLSVDEASLIELGRLSDDQAADLGHVHDLTRTIIELRRDAGDLAALAHAARRVVEGDPSDASALSALRQAVDNLPNRWP